jgi:hypothetical protein
MPGPLGWAPRSILARVGVVVALVLFASLVALVSDGSDPPPPVSEVIEYLAPPPTMAPVGGVDCESRSLASRREDAFRCFERDGNTVLDPCFAASANAVWCEPNPEEGMLGEPFTFEPPSDDVVRAGSPVGLEFWLVELSAEVVCRVTTGTRIAIDDLFSNYGCSDGSFGFGEVSDLPQGTLRTVRRDASFPYSEQDLETRAVIRAWR